MSEQTPPTRDDNWRGINLTRIGDGRYKATNQRGGVLPIGSGADPDFSPVELLLAALAGCAAINVDEVTSRRAQPLSFDMTSEGQKVHDDQGSRLTGLRVTFDVTFPEGAQGDAARELLPDAIAQNREHLCTVSRTVEIGEPVVYDVDETRA